MNKIQIINNIIQSARKYNLPPFVLVAQAILETGWFKKAPFNNFFGIKATKDDIQKRKYFTTKTKEVIKGKTIIIESKFAKFNNIDEAISRYNSIIVRNFPEANKNRHNEFLFLQGLFIGKKKYATDPNYINKIRKIISDLKKSSARPKNTIKKTIPPALLFSTIFYLFNKK